MEKLTVFISLFAVFIFVSIIISFLVKVIVWSHFSLQSYIVCGFLLTIVVIIAYALAESMVRGLGDCYERQSQSKREQEKDRKDVEYALILLNLGLSSSLHNEVVGSEIDWFKSVGSLLAYHLDQIDRHRQLECLGKFLDEVNTLEFSNQLLYKSVQRQNYYQKIKYRYLSLCDYNS
jgi:hypothetical protein